MDESIVVDPEGEGFSLMSTLRFTSQSRILENACCPDKSLIVVISNDETREKLSLWSLNGAMRWEVDLQDEDVIGSHRVANIAWSPCVQLIAVAHHPPRITIHSIHDGKEKHNLVFTSPPDPNARLTGLWWTKPPDDPKKAKNADVFERKGIVTGSALSVMRSLPLLDHIVDESQRAKSGTIFGFQAFAMPQQPDPIPKVIQEWSSLPSNPTLASIQPPPDEETVDSVTEAYDTLFAADSNDQLHVFLGGTYSLGFMAATTPIASLVQAPQGRILMASHLTRISSPDGLSLIWPSNTSFSLLQHPVGRQLAQMSTVLKDLSHYVLRTLKDMRRTWFGLGRPGHPGAREHGEKFVKALEIREEGYKTGEMTTMLDLTILLAAGIRTKGMEDLLANSEHTSERGLQKWETTVAGALTSLRDSAEKRLLPAFQRMHLVLEDLHGLQQMSEWQALKLDAQKIKHALDLVPRGMLLASWLAACARREASRVKHFIAWLRYEGSKITTTADPPPVPVMHHDVVEVNEYLIKGLVQSDVDRFFTGPLPTFSLAELSDLSRDVDLASTMARAELATRTPSDLLRPCKELPPSSRYECNVERLATELVQACFEACQLAPDAIGAYSMCRSFGSGVPPTTPFIAKTRSSLCVRERYIMGVRTRSVDAQGVARLSAKEQDQHARKYIIIWDSSADVSIMCIVRFELHFADVKDTDKDTVGTPRLEYALRRLDPASIRGDGGDMPIEGAPGDRCVIQGLEFFDDHEAILVCKVGFGTEEGERIVRWHYDDLLYTPLVMAITAWKCEDIWDAVVEQARAGDIPTLMPSGSCVLDSGGGGGITGLAVNGHPKREVACVLDTSGMTVVVFDMEKESGSEGVGEDAGQDDMEGVSS